MLEALLYFIDVFGRPVMINFSGKNKFKSKFGGICTIFFFGFIIWAAYNGSRDLFSRDNPNAVSSETYNQDPRPMVLSPETFPIGIGMQTPASMDSLAFLDDSIFTVSFFYMRMENIRNQDGTVTKTKKRTTLAKERCTPAHYGDGASNYATIDLSLIYCIALDQPKVDEVRIQGTESSAVYEYLAVIVKACDNATSPIPCSSPEKISQYLSKAWLSALYLNMAVNPKNYSRPDVRFREIYSTLIDPTNYNEASIYLGHVNVTTDAGWLFPEPETKTYINKNRVDEFFVMDPDPSGTLIALIFSVDSLEHQYTRTYKTIQNVLAEVGGLANVALAVLLIVTTPYLKLKFCLSLINELFDIRPISTNKTKNDQKPGKKKKNKFLNVKIPEDSDPEKAKNKLKAQVIKSDQIKLDVKPNQTNYSLFTKSPRFSRLLSEEVKFNTKSPRSERDPLSPALDSYSSRHQEDTRRQCFTSRDKREDEDIEIQISDNNDTRKDPSDFNKSKSSYFAQSPESPTREIKSNTKIKHNESRKEKEPSVGSPTYFPLEANLSGSQQEKKETHSRSKRGVNPSRSIRSKSSSLQDIDNDQLLEQQRDKKPNSYKVVKSKVELAKLEGSESKRFSSVYAKQKFTKVSQKVIDKNDNHNMSSLIVSEDESFESLENDNKKELTTPVPSQKETGKVDFESLDTKYAKKNNVKDNTDSDDVRKAQIDNSYKIEITFWEYLFSFFYRSEAHKQKMDLLSQGIKNIDTRLDLINILKKFREIDKLKAMLLDIDQAILFNSLPQPEIKPRALAQDSESASFIHSILKKPTFVEKRERASIVFDTHMKLQEKNKKTKIDQKLIAIFKDKTG